MSYKLRIGKETYNTEFVEIVKEQKYIGTERLKRAIALKNVFGNTFASVVFSYGPLIFFNLLVLAFYDLGYIREAIPMFITPHFWVMILVIIVLRILHVKHVKEQDDLIQRMDINENN